MAHTFVQVCRSYDAHPNNRFKVIRRKSCQDYSASKKADQEDAKQSTYDTAHATRQASAADDGRGHRHQLQTTPGRHKHGSVLAKRQHTGKSGQRPRDGETDQFDAPDIDSL